VTTATESLVTLPMLLRHHAAVRGQAPALIEGAKVLSYGGLLVAAAQVAAGLRAAGVAPGARVAYLGQNSRAYFELFFGASLVGAVMVPIGWRLASIEITHILDDAAPALLFVETPFLERVAATPWPTIAIAAANDGLAAWRAGFAPCDPKYPADPDSVALQLYTSGTTGLPKGVMLTHGNLLRPREACQKADFAWERWTDTDVSIISMPIAHVSGTGWALYSLYAGAVGIIMRDFDPAAILSMIAQAKVTRIFLVPSALRMVVDTSAPNKIEFTTLRSIAYGGSPIDARTIATVQTRLGCDLIQYYGMTEAGSATALTPADHRTGSATIMASAGRPLPGVAIAIINATGVPVPNGEAGEIAIRGSGVMAGYWNQPEATAKTLDRDGWLRTGDIGELDDAGYLHVRDRLKDMIITGGENVYAAEVESVLARHPSVGEVAVIGTPDARWGEAVTAVIVLRGNAPLAPQALTAWARTQLAGYKTPRRVIFVDALPRNPSGKVLKRVLRDTHGAAPGS
jgi:long-chain acyl-CoA synthetase